MADFSLAESRMTNRLHQQAIHAFPRTVGALVLDFDGVFTDNRVYVMQDGLEAVACHRGDGMGISLLRQKGIPVLVISSEVNPVVEVRCEKIGVPCLSSVSDKLASLRQWLEVQGISLENTIYVGNDMNDLACIRAVGCGVAVADAHSSVRAAADIVLSRVGGDGAVREIIDMIVERSEAL
jgi:N-acylneuraminate cytidylyltransferase